ncbi:MULTISPECIES: hypothetical protein [Streptomyces]|uniref:hypothetical protein n=1 Tax=Streptomyces TaxID=1883 RepID=UPI00199AD3CB|nr:MULTISPECIES: hypothetical protein [Streptomyces]UFR04775.1 hypothetical protein KBP30_28055 [Streptomyces sp. Go40/10]GGS43165.1 hypothetical protein GCM10010206_00430 [Streptomyces cinerochromogenes]
MNMLSSGIQLKAAGADGAVPSRPARAALVIEDLDSAADHAVALSTFCIQAEAAVPAPARRAGRLDA